MTEPGDTCRTCGIPREKCGSWHTRPDLGGQCGPCNQADFAALVERMTPSLLRDDRPIPMTAYARRAGALIHYGTVEQTKAMCGTGTRAPAWRAVTCKRCLSIYAAETKALARALAEAATP